MKKAKPFVVIAGAAVLVLVLGIAILAILFRSTEANATDCYSRIDNTLVQEITPHGGMNYRYTLQVYAEDGTASALELDTSRVLRDGAYIKITTAPLRGVLSWAEMQYGELPPAVQAKYPQ
ncbi:MAG: YxeA family protein [Oscillospiraceae bacterium]|nr:YxeA family protein [Oscillospiraceae bacterium]